MLGNRFSSIPATNTVPNSSPLAMCTVISATRSVSDSSPRSMSVSRATCCTKVESEASSSAISFWLSTKSLMLLTNSCTFS